MIDEHSYIRQEYTIDYPHIFYSLQPPYLSKTDRMQQPKHASPESPYKHKTHPSIIAHNHLFPI